MPSDELARCAAEQARCGEHIRAGLPGQEGARSGAADWIAEEALIRKADSYNLFLARKSQSTGNDGFKPLWMPSWIGADATRMAKSNISLWGDTLARARQP